LLFWHRFDCVWLQSSKTEIIWPKKKKFLKKSKNIFKNAELHADFKSLEKVLKNAPKKL
jgi:hypothetical protein